VLEDEDMLKLEVLLDELERKTKLMEQKLRDILRSMNADAEIQLMG